MFYCIVVLATVLNVAYLCLYITGSWRRHSQSVLWNSQWHRWPAIWSNRTWWNLQQVWDQWRHCSPHQKGENLSELTWTVQGRIWLVKFLKCPKKQHMNCVSSMYIIFFSLNLTSNSRWEAAQWRKISFILSDFMRWNLWPSTMAW